MLALVGCSWPGLCSAVYCREKEGETDKEKELTPEFADVFFHARATHEGHDKENLVHDTPVPVHHLGPRVRQDSLLPPLHHRNNQVPQKIRKPHPMTTRPAVITTGCGKGQSLANLPPIAKATRAVVPLYHDRVNRRDSITAVASRTATPGRLSDSRLQTAPNG